MFKGNRWFTNRKSLLPVLTLISAGYLFCSRTLILFTLYSQTAGVIAEILDNYELCIDCRNQMKRRRSSTNKTFLAGHRFNSVLQLFFYLIGAWYYYIIYYNLSWTRLLDLNNCPPVEANLNIFILVFFFLNM